MLTARDRSSVVGGDVHDDVDGADSVEHPDPADWRPRARPRKQFMPMPILGTEPARTYVDETSSAVPSAPGRSVGRMIGESEPADGVEAILSEFPVLELPEIDSFTEDEILMARVSIGIVRAGGSMYSGRLLECSVARLLGASFPEFGTSPWDLIMDDGTRIEVRSGASAFSLRGRKNVHVWVFVHKDDSEHQFSVASAAEVAARPQRSVSRARLVEWLGYVDASGLAAAVDAARDRLPANWPGC